MRTNTHSTNMDTRKLILHIDGDSGVQSRIELEDFGTTHYIDGDTDMVAELVRRWNAYPEMKAALKVSNDWLESALADEPEDFDNTELEDAVAANNEALSKYQPVTPA